MPPKPLRSEIKNPPDRQFAHFGVLDTGGQSKSAFVGSLVFNVILVLIAIIIGASVKHTIDKKKEEITLVVPLKDKPPEPPKPKIKIPPPPKLITPPKLVIPEPPKIKLPDVKPIEIPKPVPVAVAAPKPMPVIMPAPPKIQTAAAAPKVISVTMAAKSASVVNNDPHPSAVRLGTSQSPIPNQLKGPAVAAVNMNRGLSGMPPTNSGGGPPAKAVSLGNGQPGGRLGGTAPAAVAGVKMGCVGCTGKPGGNGTGIQAARVSLGGAPPPPPPPSQVTRSAVRTGPQVLYKPKPNYTADATAAHIEGSVLVNVKVSASGVVTVLGIAKGLGHGLDQEALRCAAGIRFKPAVDAAGNPQDWEGVVTITFQMA
jgi:protein TonB